MATLTTIEATSLPLGRTSSTVSSQVSSQSTAGHNHRRLKQASPCKDTCNVVIFGDTGSGKSSLVNLITGTQTAPTSPDAMGCTTGTHVYEHDIVIQNKTMKVQLFDTPGLVTGHHKTVPTTQGQMAPKKLLKTIKKQWGIHLVMYCVQGSKDTFALQQNYKLLHSIVKGKVPIVLVVTCLECREPDMEEWWRKDETSISRFGMKFAGHACITALNIDECDSEKVKQRREESYRAVWELIKQQFPQDGTGTPGVTTSPPVRKTKNIVLFGEAGTGKSSIVNLMAGKEVAPTSLGMQRCTLQWEDYTFDFDGEYYKVFDTIGIEESGLEMKEYLAAVTNAYRFIKTLEADGGIDLLLFCVRAGRFTAALQNNYRFFHEFLCEKKVPIVLAITNLEREQRMEDWWEREKDVFVRNQIRVADHACITAADGLEDIQQQERYAESRVAIRNLVKKNVAGEHNHVWTGGNNVFVSLGRGLKNVVVKNPHIRKRTLASQLTKRCGMSQETAGQLADMIEQGGVEVDAS
ncbi:P-loop containing nucleoside triphosphate hydrolase protein [Suillus occidentalis]|nr:P-loop containing nucleoside triphosphate hydrolase protein [Suillus occidentalis]